MLWCPASAARKRRHEDTILEPTSAKLDRAKKIGGHVVFLKLRPSTYDESAEDMIGRASSAWSLNLIEEASTVWHFAWVRR
jgi:hypothetical protein